MQFSCNVRHQQRYSYEEEYTILNQEGFTQSGDLGVLETDISKVSDMAKWMAMRTQTEGRVLLLGTVVIKRLQTLVWWVRDHQKHGLALDAANFDAESMTQASEMKTLRREQADKKSSLSDLGKFDPDNNNAYDKEAFMNLLF